MYLYSFKFERRYNHLLKKTITMILRSGRMIGNDTIVIDFDEASREWRKNKIYIGEGSFRYK